MDEVPRPSTLSEILDRTIQIYRWRFPVYVGIAAAPYAAVLVPICIFLLLGLWLGNGSQSSPASIGPMAIVLVLGGILMAAPVWIVVTALATGALSHAAAHCYFGDAITIRGTCREAWDRKGSYIGLYLLEILLIWAAPVFVWTLLMMTGAALAALSRSNGLGSTAGVLLGIIAGLVIVGLVGYAIWMLLRLSLAFPASAVERVGVMDALKRGPLLSRGTKGRIFVLYLLGVILNYLLTLAILLPLTVVAAFIPGLQNPQHAQTVSLLSFVALYGMGIAAQALVKPLYAIAMVLFYFDQRIRQEGFDIEWMMLRAGLVVPAPAQPEPQPWMPSTAVASRSAESTADQAALTLPVLPHAAAAESAPVAEGETP
jgi:hypothetical protein